MSTYIPENSESCPTSDAKSTRKPRANHPRRYPNSSRVQLAYTTKWALDDMLDAAREGRAKLEEMRRWIKREELDAKGRYDQARLARLGELSGLVADLALHVSALERLASDARVGIYDGPRAQIADA